MKPSASLTSSCRHCRYYMPQGRRGGHCAQLNVTVQSRWSACSLALPPFVTAWENFEEIILWQQKALALQAAAAPDYIEPSDRSSSPVSPAKEPAVSYSSRKLQSLIN